MSPPLLLLIVAAAPLAPELEGPPPRRLESPASVSGVIPRDWLIDSGSLATTPLAKELFEASASGPEGPTVGLACRTTGPESFPLSRTELSARGLPWTVRGGWTVYVPAVLKAPPRISVYRDETKDKNPLLEITFGVISLGLSTLRLRPTLAAVIPAPQGGRARAGSFTTECRPVGLSSVERARAHRSEPCQSLACLELDAALFGPEHPDILRKAQEMFDAAARLAETWRRQATWKLRSIEITNAVHCGPSCVRLTVRNPLPVATRPPRFDEGLDASGRSVTTFLSGSHDPIAPGQSAVLTMRTSVEGSNEAPTWPIVLRTDEDRWVHEVPASFTENGVEYLIDGTPQCVSPVTSLRYATRQLRMRRLGSMHAEADQAWLSDGSTTHLSLPFVSDAIVDGQVEAWVKQGCPAIIAVGGRVEGWRYVLVP